MRNLLAKLPRFLKRLAHDRRGVSAVTFAITFSVLAPMSLGIFDVFTMTEQHGKLQDAVDAAALYAARSTATTTADVNTIGNKALSANLQLIPGATLKSSNFSLVQANGDTKVVGTATVDLPAYAPSEFSHKPIGVTTEVTRPGNNLEVAIVLDNTGSMLGSPISSLKTAAGQLVDLVVSDTQTPYYSKVAIVPYSNSVNAASWVSAARGTPTTSCTNYGCDNYRFRTQSGSRVTWPATTCVSERTGMHAYDDAAPGGAPVQFVYQSSSDCGIASIQPLTSNKTTLHSKINGLVAAGSTAGHIGLAWGWYMVSPDFGSIFPSASQPAAYGTDKLIKAVVLMTDGAFNTGYCNGVVAQDSGSGSGGTNTHINCDATNGDSFSQAQTLCRNMKALAHPIIIYTVGFNVGSDPDAQAIMRQCATDANHVYFPSDGTSLQVAFQAIASDLNRLRISK